MAINRKYLGPFDGVVRAHGILAGNTTLPTKWVDNAGSMCRRIFGIEFSYKPQRSESDLLEKLRTVELPYILRKINWCYRHATILLDGQDIWSSNMLPKHIVQQNEKLQITMNSLRGFLATPKCVYTAPGGPLQWIPLKDFQIQYKAFCGDNNRQFQMWSDELYTLPFRKRGIIIQTGAYVWDNNAFTDDWLQGVCVQEESNKMTHTEGRANPAVPVAIEMECDFCGPLADELR